MRRSRTSGTDSLGIANLVGAVIVPPIKRDPIRWLHDASDRISRHQQVYGV
jgi:hypothetical protein